MITFGICLIYYGIALFLYQVNSWMFGGVWLPFPVRRAWEPFLGSPSPRSPLTAWFVDWLLSWPLSLALICTGLSILGLVMAARWALERRRIDLRRKWLLEQCKISGYKSWSIPKVLDAFDRRTLAERTARKQKAG